MKKVLSMLMLFVLVLSMTACASKKDEDTSSTTETATDSATTGTESSTSTDATSTEAEPVTIIMTNGKGEIDLQFQAAAAAFMETHPNITVEAYSVAVGDTVPIFEKLTSSGKTVTLAMLEPNAVLDKYADFGIDLSGEKWLEETVYGFTNPSGQVVGFPFAIEGMGLVYNQKVLDAAVGGTFDPFSIVTQDDLVALFDKIQASGIEFPIAYQTEGWSVANHFGSLFINQNEDPNVTVADIAAGTFDFVANETWNAYFNTMDILKDAKYNKYGERPVGSYYDDAHLAVGSGTSAMLFNGNWAYDSLKAVAGDEFGFIPVPVDNDPNNRLNGKLVAGPTQIFAINKLATEAEQAAAKEFLNWLVYDEKGQDFVVNQSQIISAFKSNPYQVTNPLGGAIAEAIALDKVLPFSTNYVNAGDYYNILGPAVQKYIDGVYTREELSEVYNTYYKEKYGY